jgi:hypothetical protein
VQSIDAARLVLWGNAVACGRVPADAMTHAVGPTRWYDTIGDSQPLPVALVERRSTSPVRLRLILPVSGDAGALRAAPPIVAEAVARSAAIVLEPVDPRTDDACMVLLPREAQDQELTRDPGALALLGQVLPEPVAAQSDVATCARDLARAMAEAAEALSALDVGDGRAQAERELLQRERLLASPPTGADPRAQQLLHRSLTVLTAVEIAQRGPSRAVSATELRLRGNALSDLGRAARRGIEAAVGPGWAGPLDATRSR